MNTFSNWYKIHLKSLSYFNYENEKPLRQCDYSFLGIWFAHTQKVNNNFHLTFRWSYHVRKFNPDIEGFKANIKTGFNLKLVLTHISIIFFDFL